MMFLKSSVYFLSSGGYHLLKLGISSSYASHLPECVNQRNIQNYLSHLTIKARGIKMKEFIEQIVKVLVDKPDEVIVTEVTGHSTIICELKVGEGDLGKVIGKRGQTAKSIRMLVSAASAKRKKRVVLEILE